jgi:hypothetical protein
VEEESIAVLQFTSKDKPYSSVPFSCSIGDVSKCYSVGDEVLLYAECGYFSGEIVGEDTNSITIRDTEGTQTIQKDRTLRIKGPKTNNTISWDEDSLVNVSFRTKALRWFPSYAVYLHRDSIHAVTLYAHIQNETGEEIEHESCEFAFPNRIGKRGKKTFLQSKVDPNYDCGSFVASNTPILNGRSIVPLFSFEEFTCKKVYYCELTPQFESKEQEIPLCEGYELETPRYYPPRNVTVFDDNGIARVKCPIEFDKSNYSYGDIPLRFTEEITLTSCSCDDGTGSGPSRNVTSYKLRFNNRMSSECVVLVYMPRKNKRHTSDDSTARNCENFIRWQLSCTSGTSERTVKVRHGKSSLPALSNFFGWK